MLRAGAGREMRIMFPMVANVSEFDAAKALVQREIAHLQRHGYELPVAIKLGVMVEVPSILWQLDEILERVDFLSVGSNDLVQYLFAADRDKLTEAKADLIFAPDATEMYPAGFATTVSLAGPAAVGLEDAFRPTHFAGVATVVCKLFTQCRPHVALFGEKDFQQLKVVTHMARDLDLGVQVIGAPTVRDPDGLAMSSRNRFLGAQERTTALTLHRTMVTEAAAIRAGEPVEAALARGRAVADVQRQSDIARADAERSMASMGVMPMPPAMSTLCGASSARGKLLRGALMRSVSPTRRVSCSVTDPPRLAASRPTPTTYRCRSCGELLSEYWRSRAPVWPRAGTTRSIWLPAEKAGRLPPSTGRRSSDSTSQASARTACTRTASMLWDGVDEVLTM
jgi:hypothetical protein